MGILFSETGTNIKVCPRLKKASRASKSWLVSARGSDRHDQGTHLTIYWGRNVQSDKEKNNA